MFRTIPTKPGPLLRERWERSTEALVSLADTFSMKSSTFISYIICSPEFHSITQKQRQRPFNPCSAHDMLMPKRNHFCSHCTLRSNLAITLLSGETLKIPEATGDYSGWSSESRISHGFSQFTQLLPQKQQGMVGDDTSASHT